MKKTLSFFLWAVCVVLTGCGSTPSAPTLNLSGTPALDAGQSLNITSNEDVTWNLSGPGSLTNQAARSVTYTAPGVGSFIARRHTAKSSPVSFASGVDPTATITATSKASTSKVTTLTINLTEPPVIPAATLPNGIVGTSYNQTITATGGAGTLAFTVTTGSLPTGLTLSSAGAITGTPTTVGTSSFTVKVTDSSAGGALSATQNFSITVNQAPSITSANSTTFVVGTAGTFTVTTTGTPTPSLTESGALPSGVTFKDNGNGTGTLSGTPATGTAANYAITFTASNGIGTAATQNFTLTVGQPAAITSAGSTTFAAGTAGTFSVTTTGFPAPALTETGALPTGVTFKDNGNGTATLSGTPGATTGGTYALTIKAHNGIGTDATQSFTLTVNQTPAITSANKTTFTLGTAGTFTVTTSGFPTPSITETGTLPSGVTFVDNHNGTGTLAGIPATGTAGNYPITFTPANGVGSPAAQSFTLTVGQPPSITSGGSATFTVGMAGTFTVTTGGFPAPSLTETGTLPSGVTFKDNGNGTGTLSGTPATGTGKTYSFTFTASNGVGSNATQSFTLTVDEAPSITSATSATFSVGAAGTFTVTTTGFPAPGLSESGTLPSGVTFKDNGNGTGTLSGTPAAATNGTYSLTFTASNGVGTNATQSFTLTVNTAPVITSANATTFTVGTSGSFTITATGTPTPTITESGSLPGGVTFTGGTGSATLSGTPAANTGGTYTITFTASNGVGTPATQTFTLTVDQAPTITSASSTTFTEGASASFTVTTTGFPKPAITEAGALPSGVTFKDNGDGTGTLSGTPASGTSGTFSITFTATNSVGTPATQTFTLTVNSAPVFTTSNMTTFIVGTPGTFTVTASGTPNPTISESGALPSGVTFTGGTGSGTLSGTPAATTGGTYAITFTATSSTGTTHQTFTLTVNEAPKITSATSTTFTVGVPGSFTVTTTGFPKDPITEAGSLPSGVTFVDNGNNTATLSGTPASGTAGNYPIVITASNGVLPNATQNFTLTVSAAAACTLAGKQLAFELVGDTSAGPAAMVGSITVAADGSVSGALDFRTQSALSTNQSISGPAASCSNSSVAGTGTINFTATSTSRTLKFAMRADGKQGFVAESDSSGFSGAGQIQLQSSPSTPLAGSYGFGLFGGTPSSFLIVIGAACTNSSGAVTFLQADIGVSGTSIITLTGASNAGSLSAPDANGRITTTTPFTYTNGTTVDSSIYNIDGTKAFVLNTGGSSPSGPVPSEVGFISGKSGSSCLPTTAGSFTNSSIGNSVFSAQGVDSSGVPAGFIGVLNNFSASAGTASITDDELSGGMGGQGLIAQSVTYSVSSVGLLTLGVPNKSGGTSNSFAYLDGAGNAYLMIGDKTSQGVAFGIVAPQTATTVGAGTYAFGSPIGPPSAAPLSLLPVTEVSLTSTTISDLASGGSSGSYTCDSVGRCTAPALNNSVTFGDTSVAFYVGGNTDSATSSAFIVLLQTKAPAAQNSMLSH